MKSFYPFFTIILLLTIGCQAKAETEVSVCEVTIINSPNGRFFLRTIPFDNIIESSDGKTLVFNSDSVLLYEIDRYFEVEKNKCELFLSNDGNTIAYVIDREYEWDTVLNKSIQLYKKGVAFKQFQLNELIDCDEDVEDCYLFYKEAIEKIYWENDSLMIKYKKKSTAFERKISSRAIYFLNDMLYIFTKKATLLTLDLNTTHLHTTALSKVNPERFRTIRPYSYKVENFDVSTRLFLPSLSTGSTLQEGLAEHLDMKIFVGKNFSKSKYMCYSAFIEIMLDKNGNAKLVKIDYNNHLPENRIREFIESEIFSTGDIPLFTDKWRFKDWINLMNKNPEEAELEKQKEIQEKQEALKKRIVADSIDGQYIPKNLEECFLELNKLLKQKDINAIRKLKNSGETIDYHHGLGTWLRNNWGLWAGSRLQQYLIGKGIYHPDDMSGTILELYQEWLTNKHDNWKELEAKPLQIRREDISLKTEVKSLELGINVQIQKMK